MKEEDKSFVAIFIAAFISILLIVVALSIRNYNVHVLLDQEIQKGTDPQKAACAHNVGYNCDAESRK